MPCVGGLGGPRLLQWRPLHGSRWALGVREEVVLDAPFLITWSVHILFGLKGMCTVVGQLLAARVVPVKLHVLHVIHDNTHTQPHSDISVTSATRAKLCLK